MERWTKNNGGSITLCEIILEFQCALMLLKPVLTQLRVSQPENEILQRGVPILYASKVNDRNYKILLVCNYVHTNFCFS